jgi:CP family cyanate transporter-like MFS transporter
VSAHTPATRFTPRTVAFLGMAGVLLLALSARTGVAALAPIAGDIEVDIALDGIALGLLGMIPPVAYGIAGWLTRPFAARMSLEQIAVIVGLIAAAGHILRGVVPTYAGLFVATTILMLAVGVTNVLLPAFIKLYAPGRIGPMTSAYSLLMAMSTAAPAIVGVWLADQFGWRWSLASWAVVSAIAVIPWVVLIPGAVRRRSAERVALLEAPPAPSESRLWLSPTAKSFALMFGLSGFVAYSIFAVLPAVLMETAGMGRDEAGFALFLWSILGVPMSIVIPLLAVRQGWAGRLTVLAGASGAVGFLGLLLLPTVGTMVWVTATALSTLNFPLVLTLIADRTENHHTAAQLSGMVNTVGYLIAASGPITVGVLQAITGSWEPSLVLLGLVVTLNFFTYRVVRRGNSVNDELRQISSAQDI